MPSKQKAAASAAVSGRTATESPEAKPTASVEKAVTGAARRWSVTIPYVPPTVVAAADEAEAWEKFKARWGIVKSDHVPAIMAVGCQ
jgi:hypothetical protein